MVDHAVRLESLGARLDALSERALSSGDATPESRRRRDHLRAQCDGLREDLAALEALGAPAVPGMTVIIEQALDVLERASATSCTAPEAPEEVATSESPRTRRGSRLGKTTRKASTTRRK
jgi:hypothetical protein